MQEPYPEPDSILNQLNNEDCAIALFGGQTHLYISKRMADSLGREKIERIVNETFGSKTLNEFRGLRAEYTKSYFIELPPIRDINNHYEPRRMEKLNKNWKHFINGLITTDELLREFLDQRLRVVINIIREKTNSKPL